MTTSDPQHQPSMEVTRPSRNSVQSHRVDPARVETEEPILLPQNPNGCRGSVLDISSGTLPRHWSHLPGSGG